MMRMDQQQDCEPTLDKASFDDIYVQPDPRAYFAELGALDYEVPAHGARVFGEVLAAMDAPTPTVLDLCCSYGVNAALLSTGLDLDDLYQRYRSPEIARLSVDELVEADREHFARHRTARPPVGTVGTIGTIGTIGLDVADPAVSYAVEVGLLDVGHAEDLEAAPASDALAESAAAADLITVTGGIGYITERTFERLLAHTSPDRRPWVAALCLRTVPFDPIADCLAEHGLVTEQLTGVTFPQRRFVDDDEQQYALTELDVLGIDPSGKEDAGRYHVEVYVARPPAAVESLPVEDLLAPVLAG
jgi:hypothetical protein